MIDTLFDTKEKRDLALANMANLKNHAGWQLVVSILEANIELVKEQILTGVENETKEMINQLRDKLKAYENLKDTPDKIIKGLETGEPAAPNLDPFQTVDELIKQRKSTR